MATFFLSHWFHFFFWGGPQPSPSPVWYERAVWGNVVADIPLGLIAGTLFVWHLMVTKRLHSKIDRLAAKHDQHAEKLKLVLDALDPETDGGLAVLHERLLHVEDALDLETPGGLRAVLDAIESK